MACTNNQGENIFSIYNSVLCPPPTSHTTLELFLSQRILLMQYTFQSLFWDSVPTLIPFSELALNTYLYVPYAITQIKESLQLRFFIGEQGYFMHRALGLFKLTWCEEARRQDSASSDQPRLMPGMNVYMCIYPCNYHSHRMSIQTSGSNVEHTPHSGAT